MNVSERVALVTGGSRGIGKSIVVALATAGAKVAFIYQSNKEAADALVAELTGQGREVYAIQANVANKAEADAAIENVVAKWGRLDILVNNAGIIRDKLVLAMSAEEWNEVINTNLTSVFIPVKRLGKPEDIANAVLFLASNESSYITGQTIKVDGGLTLGGMG